MKKFIGAVLCLFFAPPLLAQERILNFDAHAKVQTDGKVLITETITLNAEHKQIRRGIYRDVPLTPPQTLRALGLEMDGKSHPYFTENFPQGVRVNFGGNNDIPRGVHTYTFTYEMDNVIGFFKNYDEIYWNATGNNWIFPIQSASARVTLPPQARALEDKISVYTGPAGSKAQNAVRDGLAFRTTLPLPPHSGLTVAVPFHKGVVQPSATLQKHIQKQKTLRFAFWAALTGLFLYGYWIWKRRGKDPAARAVRRFDPPEGVSPAFARCLSRMGPDVKATAVALCSLSMKGLIEIKETKTIFSRSYQITKKTVAPPELPAEEAAAFNALPNEELSLTGKYDQYVETLNKRIVKSLRAQCGKKYFRKNRWWTAPVWVLCGVLFIRLIFELGPGTVMPLVFLCCAVSFFLAFRQKKPALTDWLMMIVFVLISLPVFMREWPNLRAHGPLAAAFAFSLIGAMWFTSVMRAYTPRGRKLMDEIDGFKAYLSVGEGTRAAASDPTDKLKIFCDYLPYALALDVDNEWIKRFSAALGSAPVAQAAAARGYAARGNLNASLGAMSASFAGAAAPSRGASGGGGRGFSGGGFGGGGGGGR